MLFGASTFIWVSPFSSENFSLLRKVSAMGYDILEIAVENTEGVDWKELKTMAGDLGLKLTVSGAFGTERDISSDNPSYRKTGLDYIRQCIRIASRLESPLFGGPLYAAVGKTRITTEDQRSQEREWCIEGLTEACRAASDYGVTLGLEPLNRFETDMINTVDQALSLIRDVGHPQLKLVLDTFHANIEEKNIADTIRKTGRERLCHIQGNESDRGTPGTGHLEWEEIRQALTEIDYQGAMVIETFGQPSKALARAACIWRPLAGSADELAEEGLSFYRKMFGPL